MAGRASGTPTTARASAAQQWARRMLAACGEDTGDGRHFRIPLSQAELNARAGHDRNSGTIGGYLRELGPAVVSRRPLVIDRDLIVDCSAPAPTVEARPLLERLIA